MTRLGLERDVVRWELLGLLQVSTLLSHATWSPTFDEREIKSECVHRVSGLLISCEDDGACLSIG